MKHKRLVSFVVAAVMLVTMLLSLTAVNASAEGESPKYITVAQPITRIIGDISMIREISSKEEMDEMLAAEGLPATAIYTINAELKAVNEKGEAFAAIDEIFSAHDYKIIPAFRINDSETADALVGYINGIAFYDCFVVSKDPALVNTVRTLVPYISGAIDYTDVYKDVESLDEEECLDLRRSIKKNNGTVAILPINVCSKETVQYLYEHQVNVWTISAASDEVAHYNALLSGAIGVISDYTQELLDIACNKLPENTMTRMTLNIAHRGLGAGGPENSIEGTLATIEKANPDVVEIDIKLTADNEIVLIHDDTTGRFSDVDLPVATSTLAQLKEIYINKGVTKEEFMYCRIPTFQEFLAALKGSDCHIFVEVKTGDTNIIPLMKECIEEAGMYGQCTVITFSEAILTTMREVYPEMAVSALLDSETYEGNTAPEAYVRTYMESIGTSNAYASPGWPLVGDLDVRAAYQRGFSLHPWTITPMEIRNYFKIGTAGLTHDSPNLIKRLPRNIDYSLDSYVVEENGSIPLTLTETVFSGASSTKSPTNVVILSGEENVRVEGDTMTFTQTGRVKFVLEYSFDYNGWTYNLMTQPINVATANAPEETTTPEITTTPEQTTTPEEITSTEQTTESDQTTSPEESTSPEETTAGDNNAAKKDNDYTVIIICVAAVVVIAIVVAVVVVKKKK